MAITDTVRNGFTIFHVQIDAAYCVTIHSNAFQILTSFARVVQDRIYLLLSPLVDEIFSLRVNRNVEHLRVSFEFMDTDRYSPRL